MAETTTTTADDAAMRSVVDAMREAATTASEHAAQVKHSASGPGPMVLSMPRFLLLSRCPRRTQ